MNQALTRALDRAHLDPTDRAALNALASELRRLGIMGQTVGDQLLADVMRDTGIEDVSRSVDAGGDVTWEIGCGGASGRVTQAGLYWRSSEIYGKHEMLLCLHQTARSVIEASALLLERAQMLASHDEHSE